MHTLSSHAITPPFRKPPINLLNLRWRISKLFRLAAHFPPISDTQVKTESSRAISGACLCLRSCCLFFWSGERKLAGGHEDIKGRVWYGSCIYGCLVMTQSHLLLASHVETPVLMLTYHQNIYIKHRASRKSFIPKRPKQQREGSGAAGQTG